MSNPTHATALRDTPGRHASQVSSYFIFSTVIKASETFSDLLFPSVDLDECTNSTFNRCQQTCINSVGSYQCACHEGFQLQEDEKTCKCNFAIQMNFLQMSRKFLTLSVVPSFTVRLELVPELQTLLANYESMSKRLTVLEQVRNFKQSHP